MQKNKKKQCAIVLVGFGILCLVMSLFFNMGQGKAIKKTLPATGGMVGPVEVKKDRSVYLIKVKQNVGNLQWSSVTGELLDEQKEYLFGFGKEFWAESGRDYEGYWSESVTNFNMKLTIPKKGTYFLNFDVEKSSGVNSSIYVSVSKKAGSALPFFWGGIISLICGVAVYQLAEQYS